jgi:hypothetical protein
MLNQPGPMLLPGEWSVHDFIQQPDLRRFLPVKKGCSFEHPFLLQGWLLLIEA